MITHAVRNGAVLGGITIALVIIIYVIDFTLLVTFKFLGLSIVIGLGMVIYAGINYRNEIGGYLTYGKAFMHGALLLAVSGIIGTLFNIVLYTVVDPELGQKMTDALILNTEEMMAGFGAPQATIDQAIGGMRTEMPDQFKLGGLLYGYVKFLIWYAVIALLTALFVRKNEPVEM